MSHLTREDLIDLDRWYSIQFASPAAAAAALERYRRYRAAIAASAAQQGPHASDTSPASRTPDLAA